MNQAKDVLLKHVQLAFISGWCSKKKIKIKMQFLSRIFRMAFHLECLHSFYFSYWQKVQSINLAKQDVTADVEKRENKGYRSWDCKEVKSDEARHDE